MVKLITSLFTGLRFRLLLLVVLVSAPPVALTLYTGWEGRQRQGASWQRRAVELSRTVSGEESRLIGETRQLLLAAAEAAPVRAGQRAGSRKLLAKLLADYPRYANLGVVRTNGELVASALPLPGVTNLADRVFFRRALQSGDFVVEELRVTPSLAAPLLFLAQPARDRTGQVQAVVFAAVDVDWFTRFESDLEPRLPKQSTWARVDRTGAILARHPAPEAWVGRHLTEGALLEAARAQGEGVWEGADASGVPIFHAFAAGRSDLVPGHVYTIVSIPTRALFGEVDRVLKRNLAWLGVAMVLALAMGWMGSRYLVLRPVHALVQSSARLGSGDLQARTGLPHRRTELGQLARAFDQMAEALEHRELERQRAEEALQTRETMIRELPLLPAAVYVCDAFGTIELYNRTAIELWGYEPPDHFASRRFCGSHRLYYPDGQEMPAERSPMAEVLRTGNLVRNRELVIERPDGSRLTVLANTVPLRDAEGLMFGAICCLQDITDRKLAEEQLRESSRKLEVLSRRLVEVQESERRHIARELHDEIGQSLTVVELNLQAAMQSPAAAAVASHLNECASVVDRVLEQVHDLSLNLRPSMLDDLGLEPALRWYTDRQASLTGMRADFHAEALDHRVDPVIETACFRVAQEALTNVVRHSRARAVNVSLRREGSRLHLSVRDDGVGFEVAAVRERAVRGSSLGLLSMEERAVLAGGGLEYRSEPGKGTEVSAWFPLQPLEVTE